MAYTHGHHESVMRHRSKMMIRDDDSLCMYNEVHGCFGGTSEHVTLCAMSCVTRRKQQRPGIASNDNTTHVPTARSCADPTKPNHTTTRHTRAKDKMILQMVMSCVIHVIQQCQASVALSVLKQYGFRCVTIYALSQEWHCARRALS